MVAQREIAARTRFFTEGPQPNGLQATADGLWVIDQHDLYIYLLAWADGAVLKKAPTNTNHSSGITWDGRNVWVASTFPPVGLMQIDPNTGGTLRSLPVPGATEQRGAHGLEWINGKLWVTVPPSATTYELDPVDGRVLRQFPAPGRRPHGLAWDGETLWCAETTLRTITRYTLDGELLEIVHVSDGPDPHGLTWHSGELWYCDAATRAVCTLQTDPEPLTLSP
jgi:sugar lactone lactonase YvrE